MGELYERVWPAQDAKAGVVIVHGLAEHSGRYDHVARALNQAGYSVYAQDLRGHGHSIGFPGDMGGDPARITSDIAEHCSRVRTAHDKVFLLAHSMGTLFALPAAGRLAYGTIHGLILSGTAVVPGEAAAELLTKGSVPPETISRDEAVVQAYKDDPLVFEKVPNEVLAMAMEVTETAKRAIPNVSVPVLLLHGTEDKLCALAGANYVWVQLIGVDKVLQGYPGLYHEVLNEPERDQVIADIVRWLDAH
jgi:acylglycerol lipase